MGSVTPVAPFEFLLSSGALVSRTATQVLLDRGCPAKRVAAWLLGDDARSEIDGALGEAIVMAVEDYLHTRVDHGWSPPADG